jgi:iron complex outermembrane recepter protein
VRGQLEFDATEALTGRLTVTYERQPRHESGTYKVVSSYVGDDGLPALLPPDLDANGTGPGNDFTGYRDPNSSAFDANFNNVGYTFNDKFSPTLHLDWKLGSATISSLTNYTEFESGYNEDTDGGPVDFAQFLIEQDLRQWSQELRATGSTDNLQWTSGVFYLNTSQRAKEQFVFPELSGSDFAYNTVNELQQKLESIGLFGQLEYSFSDQWRGTLGARYTYDDKSMDQQNYFPELGNGYEGGTGSTVYDPPLLTFDFSEDTFGSLARHKEGMWSGKIQIDYLATDDSLIYASVSRGVKGPAFNLNLGGVLTAEETPVKSEYVYALETGAKVDLLDRRLRVNGSVYYYDYHDFQGFAFNGVASKLDNFDGTFKGGELEVTLAPDESTTIQASAAYLDTELQGVSSPYYLGTRNTNSVSAPEWLFNGLVSKTFQMPADNSLALQWSFDYLSESFSSVDNNRATLVEGSFVHNARLAYKAKSSGLEVAAFVNNISNEERMQNSFDLTLSTGSLLRTYGRPRWVGLSIRKTW